MNEKIVRVKMKGNIFLHSLILVISTMIICSCATTAKYETKLNTWLGHDINELITAQGYPSNEYTMPNGNKMYTWLWIGNTLVTSNYIQYLNMTLTNAVTYWCKTSFTVDNSGRITNWRYEGNACKSY